MLADAPQVASNPDRLSQPLNLLSQRSDAEDAHPVMGRLLARLALADRPEIAPISGLVSRVRQTARRERRPGESLVERRVWG